MCGLICDFIMGVLCHCMERGNSFIFIMTLRGIVYYKFYSLLFCFGNVHFTLDSSPLLELRRTGPFEKGSSSAT